MKIKRIFAWCLVLFVGYVVLYAYTHPDELQYSEERRSHVPVEYGAETVPSEPFIKERNPLVYYVLKYQVWVFIAGILWWIIDYKRSKKSINDALFRMKRSKGI